MGIFARRKAPAVDPRETALAEAFAPAAFERAGRLENVTLLLSDIRGFTRAVERLTPAETVHFVNAYLDAVCPAITGAGGVIDKFMGDGVLAFFEGGGHASRAVYAGRRLLEAADRAALPGNTKIRVGIALHTGDVLVGTIGPRTRREYTVISDAVNTLTRLEKMNKTYGSSIVASATTMDTVDPAERNGFDGPVEVSVPGRDATIAVYVYGSATPLGDDRDVGDRLRRFVGREAD